jgi:hypothetical protein
MLSLASRLSSEEAKSARGNGAKVETRPKEKDQKAPQSSASQPPPPPTIPALRSLRQNLSQLRIILIHLHMMHPNMSLQIIWSRILVFPIRTKGTHITRRIMHQTMSNHFVLALETFTAWSTRTRRDGTEMGSI